MVGKSRGVMISRSVDALVALCGCKMDWVRPNTGTEEVEQDGAECRIAAYGKYPERMMPTTNHSPRGADSDEDSNAVLRDEEAKYCMRQKGYSFERVRGGA